MQCLTCVQRQLFVLRNVIVSRSRLRPIQVGFLLLYFRDMNGCGTFGSMWDPGARFGTHTPLTYETTGEVGHPCWPDVFAHILRNCSYLTAFDTVYVMVDTRNLRAHVTKQEGLPHWPAAVAWWQSRLQLVGPKQEKTELLFFPANEQSGTQHGQAPLC